MSFKTQIRPHNPLQGVIFGCTGALLFTLQDASFKWFSAEYSILQIIFLRSILALMVSIIWIKWKGGIKSLSVGHPKIFICSLCANVLGWYCFYRGLSQLPLTISLCVFFLTPVVIAMLSIFVLGEYPSWRQMIALVLGFVGVAVITNPFAEETINLVAVGFILISVLMWSIMAVITRALESSITIGATLLYNNIAFLIFSIGFQPLLWVMPPAEHLSGMLMLGVLGVAAQGCLVRAYRSARTAVAATTEYSALIWGALLGWWIWDEHITGRIAIGVGFIILAGLMVMQFRSRRGGIKGE